MIRNDGKREVLDGNAECEMAVGEMFEMQTPGGGGWGPADDNG